ncbi:MAG: XRE family transcriptional regulator [Propionibacteriaceae bacterium]|jgi:hypothetical protein|nr:XRE family transcriptional regulator [Propionibacteriaceae bacterium]
MKLTAKCHRSGNWWAIEVPEIPGLFTQTRRLDQVEAMVLDAVSMLDEQPEEGFSVTVVPELPGEIEAFIQDLKEAHSRLLKAEKETARINRAAAKKLSDEGLPLRDVGAILGVSHQRASQLVNA